MRPFSSTFTEILITWCPFLCPSADPYAGGVDRFQDAGWYQDREKYQDTYQDAAIGQVGGRGANVVVGVVTEANETSRTVLAVMETWGRGSDGIVFYSVSDNDRGEEEEVDDKEWAWHGKGWKRRNATVVRIGSQPVSASTRTARLLPMLLHMYRNLLNQYDWFVLTPQDMYVQLKELGTLMATSDPSQTLVLGRPIEQDVGWSGSGGSGDWTGRCEEGRGVVISRRMLREVGEALEAGWCLQEGAWHCVCNRTKMKCHHNSQVRRCEGKLALTPPL